MIAQFCTFHAQKEHKEDKKLVKGGAFKLNSHPKDLFDENPYRHDRPLPPIKDPKTSKDKPKPFKPSNPAKLVSLSYLSAIKINNMLTQSLASSHGQYYIGVGMFHLFRLAVVKQGPLTLIQSTLMILMVQSKAGRMTVLAS